MTEQPMTVDPVAIADASLHRCSADPEFLAKFYDRFLGSDERVPTLFADTEFERQRKLLRHALGLLLAYAKHANPALLERVADRHGRNELNVPVELFGNFVDALVETVEGVDPECTPAIIEAWRSAVQPGIDFMVSRH